MPVGAEIVFRLTEQDLPTAERQRLLREFAHVHGWRPSDVVSDVPGASHLANGHLFVEHGLDNSAVITFLKRRRPFPSLPFNEQVRLLNISFNYMVDWHLFPDTSGSICVSNRSNPGNYEHFTFREDANPWSADYFEQHFRRRASGPLKSIDAALIDTVSFWKRVLGVEGRDATNAKIARFFNTLFFLRALEDDRRWAGAIEPDERVLLDSLARTDTNSDALTAALQDAAQRLDAPNLEGRPFGFESAQPFRTLSRADIFDLFRDLYKSRDTPYDYDFCLISKHALSRIYEHYVSLLRSPERVQLELFAPIPEEINNRSLGAVYTPQYIARFFGRFLRENTTPRAFRNLQVVDPACGSGMFLRTLLELQYMSAETGPAGIRPQPDLSGLVGIDVDASACEAAILSLSLLHLAATGRLPERLRIINAEALEFAREHPELAGYFDAVIANPPFRRWEGLSDEMKLRTREILGDDAIGKADLFLAMLKLGMRLVRPGGFLLYVLPYQFLTSEHARKLRQKIRESFLIRYLVDLSEVPVFESVGSYVTLLILEKVAQPTMNPEPATVARCVAKVGHALQAALDGQTVTTPDYQVFKVPQQLFSQDSWAVGDPSETQLLGRLERFPSLETLLEVGQGVITGRDDVFIRRTSEIPKRERKLWLPLLKDRQISKYRLPNSSEYVVFVPFVDNERVEEGELEHRFPETWGYLRSHREVLEARRPVAAGRIKWWEPERPRTPAALLRPKILCPELMAVPRFGLDLAGRFAVSHAPYVAPPAEASHERVLLFFVAVLNSSVAYWQLARYSSKYSRYVKVGPRSLRQIRVPNPVGVEAALLTEICALVRERLDVAEGWDLERRIDAAVSRAYGLTDAEMALVGVEAG